LFSAFDVQQDFSNEDEVSFHIAPSSNTPLARFYWLGVHPAKAQSIYPSSFADVFMPPARDFH
jgi:hypothetical protein